MTNRNKKLEHGCLVIWRKRLAAAITRGYFTNFQADLAGEWDTCAIGEAKKLNTSIVKRGYHNGPLDYELEKLGFKFMAMVAELSPNYEGRTPHYKATRFKPVERILDKIEKRLEKLYTLKEK
jgi:hypothetical protein